MSFSANDGSVTILMPVYNDWQCAALLVERVEAALAQQPGRASVVLVDDGSQEAVPAAFVSGKFVHVSSVEVLRLRRNLGHQRAIAIGLSFLHLERDCNVVMVMDADGEDRPEDVVRLMERFEQLGQKQVVFAARMRRSEGWVFRLGYHSYRWLHRLLTGIPVRVGNFSILGREHLEALMVMPDLWNHYAASVLKARLAYDLLPTRRGLRLAGRSKLDLAGMVVHGLSAISVFIELVGVRLSLAILAGLAALLALLSGVVGVRLWTDLAIPGWATYTAGLLVILLVQMLTVAMGLTLMILFNRNSLSFLPVRDYKFFVGKVYKIYERKD